MAKSNRKPDSDNEKPSLEDDLQTTLLLKEADEALRQERMEALWKEWGSTIIGVAFMIIFGTMIGVGWQSWRASVHQDQTALVLNSQNRVSPTESDAELSGSFAGLSALLRAGSVAEMGGGEDINTAKRIHNYMADAQKADMPDPYNYMAEWGVLRTRGVVEDAPETKIETADAMVDLADADDNPYKPLILVEAATLYGENGQADRAIEILEQARTVKGVETLQPLNTLIDKLIRLYETDVILNTAS